MMVTFEVDEEITLIDFVKGAHAMGCHLALSKYEPEVHGDQVYHDELEKRATIKAIMSVLNAWQDSKLDKRCAEEILAAVERMR